METFSALLALCEGNSPVTDGFSSQTPVTWSFDVFFGGLKMIDIPSIDNIFGAFC